jgi:hypothetical protein
MKSPKKQMKAVVTLSRFEIGGIAGRNFLDKIKSICSLSPNLETPERLLLHPASTHSKLSVDER